MGRTENAQARLQNMRKRVFLFSGFLATNGSCSAFQDGICVQKLPNLQAPFENNTTGEIKARTSASLSLSKGARKRASFRAN
jgi:hypothetical protein